MAVDHPCEIEHDATQVTLVCTYCRPTVLLPMVTATSAIALRSVAGAYGSRTDAAPFYRSPEERREAGLGTQITEWLKMSGLVEIESTYERNQVSKELADQHRWRCGISAAWRPHRSVSLSIEYLHGEFEKAFVTDDGNALTSSDTVAAKVALEF